MTNDKVYELAKQAGMIEFESIPGSAAVTPDYESVVRARKFAELLVKECMEQVWYTREDGINGNVSEVIKDRIKEHFGVEE